MSTKTKVLGAISLIFLVTLVAFYFASRSIILEQFAEIEQNNVINNTTRAVNALTNKADQLEFKAIDWANWDDTHKFVIDHNQEYVASNLQTSALVDLGINFMLFIDNKDRLVKGVGVELIGGEPIPIPQSLLSFIRPDSHLLERPDTTTHVKGLLNLPEHPLIVVALPILTSSGDAPINGTLIFGQYLDEDQIEKLADLTQLDLNLYTIDGSNLPADVHAVKNDIVEGTHLAVPLNGQKIAGYALTKDVFNKPFLITNIQQPRTVYNQGKRSSVIYFGFIGIASMLSLLIALYITNKLVEKDKVIQLKDEFFSFASHELRTPLAAIEGNSGTVLDLHGEGLSPRAEQSVRYIRQASLELIKLVNNFLDAALLAQGHISLTIRSVSLVHIVGQVIDEVKTLADDKQVNLVASDLDILPPVKADPIRVREIIYNLIGNSLKFTGHNGSIVIHGQLNGKFVELLVTDTGAGMDGAQQRELFKRFRTHSYNGAGLGLYLSRNLAEKMGGSLDLLKSEPGGGTTFVVRLLIDDGS